MTYTEALELSGRELDMAFARAIGLNVVDGPAVLVDQIGSFGLQEYSNDANIWMVVGIMRERKWGVVYADMLEQPNYDHRAHEWSFFKLDQIGGYAHGPNSGENCCRAALAALTTAMKLCSSDPAQSS